MPIRIRLALITSLTLVSSLFAVGSAAAVTPQKVVIIVGPTGGQTDDYRQKGDSYAATATAAGASVVKVYSPNATWANVKAAVDGANIVIYVGHGNGYPNPYNSGAEPTDRDNGWGLNRATTNGDDDNWGSTMVYCGEQALLGTLTSASAAQWAYCGGSTNTDGITPAANWVMIYSNACYAPGASEGFDVPATEAVALQRVRNYSYPNLMLGAGAYFATDMGASGLIDTILRNPTMPFGAIAETANGYDLAAQLHYDHPDLGGYRIWIQNSGSPTSGSYKLAYAGKPALTPSGATGAYTEPVPIPSVPAPGLPGATTYSPPVSLVFKAGSYTGYKFDGAGTAIGLKGGSLVTDSGASTSARASIPNRPGSWFYVTNGIWAGYWVAESSSVYLASAPPPVSWPPGATTYSPPVSLVFKAGSYTGYKFDGAGTAIGLKGGSLVTDSGASTSARASIPNRPGSWFYVTNGIWAGYWVAESSSVYLASP